MDITDIIHGDRVINHVTGLLNPVVLGAHILNVTLSLANRRIKNALFDRAANVSDDSLTVAVRRYQLAAATVNDLLLAPSELINLEYKYGRANFLKVPVCAERYRDAAIDLMRVMRDVTAVDHPSYEWIIRTLVALKTPVEVHSENLPPVKVAQPMLVAVEGIRVDQMATT